MTRIYKNAEITKNMNGNWIVKLANGLMSQHSTLKGAKEYIDLMSVTE